MHNRFEDDTWKFFQFIAPTKSNYWRKMRKIAINRPFWIFFSLYWTCPRTLISNMYNKFEEDTWKTFQVIAPTRSNYWRKMRKIAINRLFWKKNSAFIELVQELLISNMHNKFEENTWKTFQVIAPTRSNYWRKMRKIAINRPFWIFFQALLNLSKNYLLVTCIAHLKRIREKLFKLSRPQGQIIDVKGEKSQLVGHFEFFSGHYWICPRTGH